MPYPQFDRSRLQLKPLGEREHDVLYDQLARLDDPLPAYDKPDLPEIARRIVAARQAGAAVI